MPLRPRIGILCRFFQEVFMPETTQPDAASKKSPADSKCSRVGILGGGQLAMLLCAEAEPLGLTTTVLAHSDDSPAIFTATQTLAGPLDDLDLIRTLIERSDVITFDVEEIPPNTLEYLAAAAAQGKIDVQPTPAAMLILQDKLKQKEWLVANGLPTAPFKGIEGNPDPTSTADLFGLPFVQKARRGGYDGRGVQIIRNETDLAELWDGATMLEPFVRDIRELSVVAARSTSGEIACFEVTELTFDPELNLLDTVIAPAPIPAGVRQTALDIATRTLEALASAGVFALELFLTKDDELLINEISPRVHNTGHHTLESCETSQFAQHLRAICGLPLGSTHLEHAAAMRNLIWKDSFSVIPWGTGYRCQEIAEGTFLHWYGKHSPRPGRKMGHITAIGDTVEQAVQRTKTPIEEIRRTWKPA
jgi:5-(carboxyamino)imidazole ribonucleotide synthase